MISRFLLLILVSLTLFPATAQSEKEFSQSKHIYIRGKSVLAGNNLLGHHATKPMMKDEVPNDAVKMKYIDVDNDKRTFSSSEAVISNVPNEAKVVYAALYWTALYPYEKGVLKTSGGKAKFVSKGDRENAIENVFFKLPGENYQEIKGEILKDGFGEENFIETSPYVCRADVTELFKKRKSVNGTYTVANVRAAEGRVSGGGSAGWVLYVVYEDEKESLKYFTSYDGLVEINKQVVDLDFTGFKGKQEGKINAMLGIGALEGDRKIPTDQLLLFSDKSGEFVPMSNSLREEKNFFISSITFGDKVYADRNPNSTNTLGFDLLTMDVPNSSSRFFDRNTTKTTLRFQTRNDRFYLFFVSFEVDMDPEYLENLLANATDDKIIIQKTEEEEGVLPGKNKEEKPAKDNEESALAPGSKLHLVNGKRKDRYPNLSAVEEAAVREDILSQENRTIPGMASGYYLVTNVFAIPENARRWTEFLIRKEFKPATFINPENNWEYIYTGAFDSFEEGFEVWKSHQDKEYFVGLWLMKVNVYSTDVAEAN
ncbi:MAG TPA: hypothetical protein VFF21_06225 [Flavobacteriaceae bacterium]|nr:hypothetical protein [Flavobacteriaceae bacterium]